MKITLLIGSLAGGGAERVVCNLANFLANAKHDVTVLTVSDKQTYELTNSVRHEVLFGESDSKLPHILINVIRMFRFNRYLRKEKVDVYITFLPKLTGMLLAQKRFVNCPIIVAERADPKTFCEKSNKNRRMFEAYYPKADGYVFQTETARDFYSSRGIDVTRSEVIANAINPAFLKEKSQLHSQKTIIAAGRLTEQKKFSLLLKAFSLVTTKVKGYTLEIYGQGPLLEQLKKEAQDLGIDKKVVFPGFAENMKEKLESASLFVLSSDFEGMPNALMEAMATGLPCVSTRCRGGGAEFLIDDHVNGILVPIGDVSAMAKGIIEILNNPDLAERLGVAASDIKNNLSPDIVYGRWEDFIISFAGQRGSKK